MKIAEADRENGRNSEIPGNETNGRTEGVAVSALPVLPGWLRELYPFETHSFMTAAGARMSYVDEGPRSDEAVLMLHGNPTWSFYYRDLVRDLSAAGLRCIAPDHIGMGLSDKPADYDYRLSVRITDIEALVEELGLKRVHLVVHDWGGAIGLGFATQNPKLVGRIVILNTAAFPDVHIPGRIALCRRPLVGPLLVRGLNGFAGMATSMAMSARKMTRAEKRGYLFPYDSWNNRVAVQRFVADIPMEQNHVTRGTLEVVFTSLPVLANKQKLIVWGGRDFCFNDGFLERWHAIYPDATIVRLADAGHYVLEDGGEAARQPVCEFLLSKPIL